MNTKRLSRDIIKVFCIAVLASCSGHRASLREAEALLETDPKAADSILASIPEPKLRHNRALYAILKTQLDYKNYRSLSDNSLILSATEYYGTKHKDYHAAMAWYSLGCTYTDANNDIAGIDAYLKAKDLFPDTLNRYYMLAEQNLGRHYLNRMMLSEAKEQFKCCLVNSERLNNIKVQKNAIYNIGCCALYNNDFYDADSIFNYILADGTFSADQKNTATFQLSKIRLHYDKDYLKAMKLIDDYLAFRNNIENSSAGLSVKADIFYKMGQLDSAYYYYSKSLDCSKDINTLCSDYDMLTLLSIQFGQKTQAIKYYNNYKTIADSIYEQRNHEQINTIESEHKIELAENQLHNRTIRFTITTASFILLSIMLAIIAVIYYRNWKKEKIWRIRESINQTESDLLNKKMSQAEQEFTAESNSNDTQDRFEIMELYSKELYDCAQLFQLQDISSMMTVKTAIRNVELTKEEKVQIIKALNDCFRPVIQFITTEIPGINKDEAYVCILSYMGYNSVQISHLLDVTDACIRQRRKRAQEKDTNNLIQLFFTEKG